MLFSIKQDSRKSNISSEIKIIVSLLIMIVCGCNTNHGDRVGKEEVQQKIKIAKIKSNVMEFAKKHDAVSNWSMRLGQWKLQYTIEIQDLLIRKDARPILIVGNVDDILRIKDKIFISLRMGTSDKWAQVGGSGDLTVFPDFYYSKELYFLLEARSDAIGLIKRRKSSNENIGALLGDKNVYAFIAKIDYVRKPNFDVTSDIFGEEESIEAEVMIVPAEFYMAKGKCLDIMLIDELEP